ncbi:hypothetical protein Cni_G25305 [Canna indica]|uniref:Uncharacterized protein n=1 Tax=Canna indica TaxID=4628 RepID=A0AAQ3KWS0_9LILI|nr:hypothetical protein Cni_G25305 [Canna indica]
MEGLIPFVYKAIVQYKNGGGAPNMSMESCLFPHDSPSVSYMRLPGGDSGRFLSSDVHLFPSSSPRSVPPSAAAPPQSPRWRTAPRR